MNDKTEKKIVKMVSKAMSGKIRVDDSDTRTVVATISSSSVDRDGEVLLPQGANLKEFKKNPVILFQHATGSLPIGRAEEIAVTEDGDGIRAKIRFAEKPDGFPESSEWLPDSLWSLVQQGVLGAFSVGFIPRESRPPTPKDIARFGEDARLITSKWTLIEVSLVAIPANPDAMAEAVSKMAEVARSSESARSAPRAKRCRIEWRDCFASERRKKKTDTLANTLARAIRKRAGIVWEQPLEVRRQSSVTRAEPCGEPMVDARDVRETRGICPAS